MAPRRAQGASDLFDANPTLGLIAARILVGPEEKLDPLSHAMATSPQARDQHSQARNIGVPVVGFAACGAVIHREAFLEAGGFKQQFGVGGEGQIVALDLLRKGWQVAYVDEIVAYPHPSSIRSITKRQRSEVRNALWSAWLRRPLASALAVSRRVLALALRDEAGRVGRSSSRTSMGAACTRSYPAANRPCYST